MDVWLWLSRDGILSCGQGSCGGHTHNSSVAHWGVLRPPELAELAALAAARRKALRCQCGAVEYDPVTRTVRETREGDTP